jgi:hypothetical protein
VNQVAIKNWACVLVVWVTWLEGAEAAPPQAVAIHWRQVPLRDAVSRLEEVFDENVFVDRRVDPSQRVSLDIEASQIEDVLAPIAKPRKLGVGRLGRLVYLGPRNAAERLPALAAMRVAEIEELSARQAVTLERRRPLQWPRLTEPRELVDSLVEERGWRVDQAERIPHDLWAAGELPAMGVAEQLTVLLMGFDLTFAVRARERTLAIVPVDTALLERFGGQATPQAVGGQDALRPRFDNALAETRQVYTLRVAEQPVRAVLDELTKRLNWQIEIDEAAIRAAGRSLDERVSFAVKNVGPDELLEEVLRPAQLSFRRDGERIKIVPRE